MERIAGIDFFRVLAMCGVIFVHTSLENYSSRHSLFWYSVINQGFRFIIPFFTIISGYFWGMKTAGRSLDTVSFKMVKRLCGVMLFWYVVYLVNPLNMEELQEFGAIALVKSPYWRISQLMQDPVHLLFEGPRMHLWFFMALLCALALAWLLRKLKTGQLLLPAGFILYIIGLLAGGYSGTPVGISWNFDTRNGPFFTTIFFAIGWWFSTMDEKRFSLRVGMLLAGVGLLIHIVELNLLGAAVSTDRMPDYLLGTLPWGIGVAVMVLSAPELGRKTVIPRIGSYTLGIYAVHFLFIDLLSPVNRVIDHYSWEFLFPAIVFTMSLGAVFVLSRNRLSARFVR